MNGKGSKRRPTQVDQEIVDHNWDIIFGGKQMKHEHKREMSRYISVNGKKEGVVVRTENGYMVELYERSKYIRTVDVSTHSLQYAEDTAENYALGLPV